MQVVCWESRTQARWHTQRLARAGRAGVRHGGGDAGRAAGAAVHDERVGPEPSGARQRRLPTVRRARRRIRARLFSQTHYPERCFRFEKEKYSNFVPY